LILLLATLVAASTSLPTVAAENADRTQVIERIAAELERGYLFPGVGVAMAKEIRAQNAKGSYDAYTDSRQLAESLTKDLQAISRDAHLRVMLRTPAPAVPDAPRRQPRIPVEGVEVLSGNIGYFKVNAFPQPQAMNARLDEAMTALSKTDALIVDLRDNPGGSPDSAMYLAGFFVPHVTLVATIYSRQDDSTTEMRTKEVKAPLYLDKPLYILTNRNTFSAGEAAAYHLKYIAHAITVGEPTGGGAHRIRPVDLGGGFVLLLPFTRPINVITKGDWESTGVTPEIAIASEQARDAAHLAALKKLPRTPEREAAIANID
jgi:hypothetical protein